MLATFFQGVSSLPSYSDEMIVVDKRFIVPRMLLRVSITQRTGQPIIISFGPGGLDTPAYVSCKDVWDWDKVNDLSLDLANIINNEKQIDVHEVVAGYLANCEYTKKFQGHG